MSSQLPTVQDVCKPREDILSGEMALDQYAASLGQVARGEGIDVYRKPELFFDNTYPTEGLKTTVAEVFGRLTGKTGSSVIKLETSLGGGKTHTLIALYHLAKHGSGVTTEKVRGPLKFSSMQVAAIVGGELGTTVRKNGSNTLWGEIAAQLGQYDLLKENDQARTSPGKLLLRQLFGTKPTLILIDEIALYLTKASAVVVGDSTLAKSSVAFLQELTEVAAETSNVCVILTSLNKAAVFSEQTHELDSFLSSDVAAQKAQKAVQEADEVVSRVVRNLTPTKSDEFARVLQHRLFRDVNRTAALGVCREYYQSLNRDGVREYLPNHVREPKYLEFLQDSYPFHPELVQVLRTKTSSITQFNQTRGVLRLLGLLVQHAWKKDIREPLIHAHHIDFNEAKFRDELLARLDRTEYNPAVTFDIADRKVTPRASLVDGEFAEPLGTMAATTIFLHSLTGAVQVKRGCNEGELQLALYKIGRDPKAVERALHSLEDRCFYLSKQGTEYAFSTEANLNRVIEEAKNAVEETHVLRELEERIGSIYGARRFFQPCIFANDPSKVPDNTDKPKLVVIHFNEETAAGGSERIPGLVQRIFEESGTQGKPRLFANNVAFLVADKDEKEAMVIKAREHLALKKLVEAMESGAPGMQALSPTQRSRLKDHRNRVELEFRVAIVLAYKHVYIPTAQRNLDGAAARKPLRRLSMRYTDTEVKQRQASQSIEEQALVQFLKDNNAARTADDEAWAPDYILDQIWIPKTQEDVDGEEFKRNFYRNPSADLILAEDLVLRAMQRGVRDGKWYAVMGNQFYDKSNGAGFVGAFTSELKLIKVPTATGKAVWEQFNCPKCKRRRSACTCEAPTCGTCGKPIAECVCPPTACPICKGPIRICGGKHAEQPLPSIEDKTMAGIIAELSALFQDREIESIETVKIKAQDRNSFVKLMQATPQFLGTTIRLDLKATINKQHIRDAQGRPGNMMRIEYSGDMAGYNAAKAIFVNYEAQEGFSLQDLWVQITWPAPLKAADLVTLLRDKVAKFTSEGLYTCQVSPAKKEKVTL